MECELVQCAGRITKMESWRSERYLIRAYIRWSCVSVKIFRYRNTGLGWRCRKHMFRLPGSFLITGFEFKMVTSGSVTMLIKLYCSGSQNIRPQEAVPSDREFEAGGCYMALVGTLRLPTSISPIQETPVGQAGLTTTSLQRCECD